MFLVDTSVFLEILLAGPRAPIAKTFLEANAGLLYVSDLTLLTLSRFLLVKMSGDAYKSFMEDVTGAFKIAALRPALIVELASFDSKHKLGHMIAYNLRLAMERGFCIVTLERSYDSVGAEIEVKYL
jgi:hypothetical protein